MSDTMVSLRRKIGGAGDLQSVINTMKALAASSIGQYEQAVSALADYSRTVKLGLSVCFREGPPMALMGEQKRKTPAKTIGAVVFGSDQGLVASLMRWLLMMSIFGIFPTHPTKLVLNQGGHSNL